MSSLRHHISYYLALQVQLYGLGTIVDTHFGESPIISVKPMTKKENFSVIVTSEDGELAVGEICLEPSFGIKNISLDNGSSCLTVELFNKSNDADFLIITSSLEGSEQIRIPLSSNSEVINVDITALKSDIYVISYISNGEIVNSKKFSM